MSPISSNSFAMEWSPQIALKAYLHTLQLCYKSSSTSIVEPKCLEFVSALAAGKQARLMLQITSEGITSLTIALAVAAKQTGGRLIVCANCNDDDQMGKINNNNNNNLIVENGLEDVIEYVYDVDPCRVVKKFKNVDFAVVDFKVEDHLKLLKILNLNPSGCMVLLNNLDDSERDIEGRMFLVDQVFKEKKEFQYATLLLGDGMELTRLRSIVKCRSKRFKRFHVTFEN